MKKQIIRTALAALALQCSAHADYELNLAFALTATSNEGALRERDQTGKFVPGGDMVIFNYWETYRAPVRTQKYESANKMIVERFSNREILQEVIVEAGVDTTIKGWTLKLVFSSVFDSEDVWIYAVKGDQRHEIGLSLNTDAYVEQFRYNTTLSYNESTERETYRAASTWKSMTEASVELDFNGFNLKFASSLAINYKALFFGPRNTRWMPSTTAFSSIIGGGREEGDDSDPSVVLGKINASGGKFIVRQ